MRRAAVIAPLAAVAALVLPAAASADDYCVNTATTCTHNYNDTQLQDALADAGTSNAEDNVIVGPGNYTNGPFSYTSFGQPVHVIGAGSDQTKLAAPFQTGQQRILDMEASGTGSTVSGLGIQIPDDPGSASDFDVGLYLRIADASDIKVTGTSAPQYSTGVILDAGSSLSNATVLMGSTQQGVGVFGVSSPAKVVDSRIAAVIGIYNGTDLTARRLDITASQSGFEATGGTTTMSDSLVNLGSSGGTGLKVGSTNPVDVTLDADHLTVVGDGSGSKGVRAYADVGFGATSSTSTVNLSNSVLSGQQNSIVREADSDDTANVTTSYSNYDQATTSSYNGPTGHGSITESNPVSGAPSFVNTPVGNFRPATGSILVDAGDPAFTAAPFETDLDGGDRTLNGDGAGGARTDLGAYERENAKPVVKIKKVTVSGHKATVAFKATDASGVAGVKCRVDKNPYASCISPKTFPGLSSGNHTVYVRATDLYTNVGKDKQSFKIS